MMSEGSCILKMISTCCWLCILNFCFYPSISVDVVKADIASGKTAHGTHLLLHLNQVVVDRQHQCQVILGCASQHHQLLLQHWLPLFTDSMFEVDNVHQDFRDWNALWLILLCPIVSAKSMCEKSSLQHHPFTARHHSALFNELWRALCCVEVEATECWSPRSSYWWIKWRLSVHMSWNTSHGKTSHDVCKHIFHLVLVLERNWLKMDFYFVPYVHWSKNVLIAEPLNCFWSIFPENRDNSSTSRDETCCSLLLFCTGHSITNQLHCIEEFGNILGLRPVALEVGCSNNDWRRTVQDPSLGLLMMGCPSILRARTIWTRPGGGRASASYSWNAFTKLPGYDLLKHPAFKLAITPPIVSVGRRPRRRSANHLLDVSNQKSPAMGVAQPQDYLPANTFPASTRRSSKSSSSSALSKTTTQVTGRCPLELDTRLQREKSLAFLSSTFGCSLYALASAWNDSSKLRSFIMCLLTPFTIIRDNAWCVRLCEFRLSSSTLDMFMTTITS